MDIYIIYIIILAILISLFFLIVVVRALIAIIEIPSRLEEMNKVLSDIDFNIRYQSTYSQYINSVKAEKNK